MKNCLLCLEINKDSVDSIEVNSTQWQKQNLNKLIEKYLWPMGTVQSSSWMCTTCWQQLYDFHKFYIRIEEAHLNLGTIMKNGDGPHIIDQKYRFDSYEYKNIEDCKYFFETDALEECHLEPTILMKPPLPIAVVQKQENIFKIEQQDVCSKDIHLNPTRKRGRSAKTDLSNDVKDNHNDDPFKKIKKFKQSILFTTKVKKTKQNTTFKTNPLIADITECTDLEQSIIKDDPDTYGNFKEVNVSFDDSDTDSKCQDDKQPTVSINKKRKNPDEQTLQEHDKIIAENFQIFCSLCQRPIENFIALRKHFKAEHRTRAFVICCEKKMLSRPELVDHINWHLDPDYFKCKVCGKMLSERRILERHLKLHDEDELKYSCHLCFKSFVESKKLENHKLTHLTTNKTEFHCTKCDKYYGSANKLNYHIEGVHLRKFCKFCDICGKSLNEKGFKRHMEIHDGNPGPIINCDICGLRLADQKSLKQHKITQHPEGGKKDHCCPICPKISPTLRALKIHMNTMHKTKNVDKHKCSICEKTFKRPAALREHMAAHAGIVLYNCPWCPKTFNSNGNLYSHRKKSHPKEWEETKRQKFSGNLYYKSSVIINEFRP